MITVKQLKREINKYSNKEIEIAGWVRTNRAQKEFGFLNINDGTTLENIQVVYEDRKSVV